MRAIVIQPPAEENDILAALKMIGGQPKISREAPETEQRDVFLSMYICTDPYIHTYLQCSANLQIKTTSMYNRQCQVAYVRFVAANLAYALQGTLKKEELAKLP